MRLAGLSAVVAFATAGCATAGRDTADGGTDAVVARDSAPTVDAFVSTCPSTDTCTAATMLGSVSGDTANAKLTAMGYRSAWYRVRVTEDNSGVDGFTLRVAAKLTSPAAVDFDVFVYVNTASDVAECSSTTGTVTASGNTDTVKAEWGEGLIPNGSDDSRNVSIEVRPKTGHCMASYQWALEVEGNWL